MDTILTNLGDPAWWFNILFPGLLVWLLPRVIRKLAAMLGGLKVRRMRRVKALRRDDLKIAYEMQKASAFYVVFVLSGAAWVVALALLPAEKISLAFVYTMGIPVLWAEFAWLGKDVLVRDVLKARDRLKRRLGGVASA